MSYYCTYIFCFSLRQLLRKMVDWYNNNKNYFPRIIDLICLDQQTLPVWYQYKHTHYLPSWTSGLHILLEGTCLKYQIGQLIAIGLPLHGPILRGWGNFLQARKFPDGYSMQFSLPSMCLSMSLTCHMPAACMWGVGWKYLCPFCSWLMPKTLPGEFIMKSMQIAWARWKSPTWREFLFFLFCILFVRGYASFHAVYCVIYRKRIWSRTKVH